MRSPWKVLQEKKKADENRNRLSFFLLYAKDLMKYQEKGSENPVFALIKVLADKITNDGVVSLLTREKHCPREEGGHFIRQFNRETDRRYGISKLIFDADYSHTGKIDTQIRLATDPVIVYPWNQDRLIKGMGEIGTDMQPWKEDRRNHQMRLILPFGVSVVCNGNHSIFTGMAKRTGSIHIQADSMHEVGDYTPLYPLLRFDGTNYLHMETGEVIGEAGSFEFGCIFEIGRLLVENGIRFHSLSLG